MERNIMDASSKYYPAIKTFMLPNELLGATVQNLRADSGESVENIVFWAGHVEHETAFVTQLIVPRGSGVYREAYYLRVDDEVIAALCELLDPPRVVVLAQVHTHLGAAFHSVTDDQFSFDTPGYLSVVVPRGGREGASFWRDWSFNECLGHGEFRGLDGAEVSQRFVTEPPPTEVGGFCACRLKPTGAAVTPPL